VGIVWKVSKNEHETILHSFSYSGGDGEIPVGGVVLDAKGNLYGTTEGGGASGDGTIYKLSKTGKETILHSFAGSDGEYPFDSVVRGANGNLYGTAAYGGSGSYGVVWKLTP
jgi:uncharacterized repeat protein (TIGR03803 family)